MDRRQYVEVIATNATDQPERRGYVLAERSKSALAAILCIVASLLSLMCLAAVLPIFGTVANGSPQARLSAGVVALVLLGGLTLGALTGHVLGLLAYSKPDVRAGVVPGRLLATTSVVAGVVLMMLFVLGMVIFGDTLTTALGYLF